MRYTLGEKLRFDSNCYGRSFLGAGWSAPEKRHCWTVGDEAAVELNIGFAPQTDLFLEIKCFPFLGLGHLEQQTIDLFANNEFITSRELYNQSRIDLYIPQKLVLHGNLRLVFKIRTPISPSDLGLSSDERKLGIDLRYLVLLSVFSGIPSKVQYVSGGKDLLGNVYNIDGGFHRFVSREKSAFLRRLCDDGVFHRLTSAEFIPDHYFREISDPSFGDVVSTVTGRSIPAAYFPTLMLKDAAKVWIMTNLNLLKEADDGKILGLRDGHGGNFIQIANARPLWCDIGSISDDADSILDGYSQFVRCFIYPLVMFGSDDISAIKIRALMKDNPDGVSRGQVLEYSPKSKTLVHCIEERYELSKRRQALEIILDIVERLGSIQEKGFWADYRGPQALMHVWVSDFVKNHKDQRYAAIQSLIRRSKASDFIDLGCNDGLFSLLCLREGMRGIAIDADEHALNKLYEFMRGEPGPELSIACSSFPDQFCCADLTLALALVHHLVLGQGYSLTDCARELALYTNHTLITEFMLDDLGGIQTHKEPYPNPLPVDYSLTNFLSALKQHFKLVEVVDYVRDTTLENFSRRVLIYCEKRIN